MESNAAAAARLEVAQAVNLFLKPAEALARPGCELEMEKVGGGGREVEEGALYS